MRCNSRNKSRKNGRFSETFGYSAPSLMMKWIAVTHAVYAAVLKKPSCSLKCFCVLPSIGLFAANYINSVYYAGVPIISSSNCCRIRPPVQRRRNWSASCLPGRSPGEKRGGGVSLSDGDRGVDVVFYRGQRIRVPGMVFSWHSQTVSTLPSSERLPLSGGRRGLCFALDLRAPGKSAWSAADEDALPVRARSIHG